MNTRVRELRKALNMTLEAFGARIGIKKSSLSQIENGINNLTEQNILSICREFNANENWLRTGEGEMFKKLDREQEIAGMTAMLFREESSSFKFRLINALSKLSESDWEVLERLAKEIVKKND